MITKVKKVIFYRAESRKSLIQLLGSEERSSLREAVNIKPLATQHKNQKLFHIMDSSCSLQHFHIKITAQTENQRQLRAKLPTPINLKFTPIIRSELIEPKTDEREASNQPPTA